ncbi:hypothetical protein ABZW58_15980 [Streptomyces cellulosae]|uniref:hypothetical protein n=1 Tax=Streptomyces sp. SID4956 TaxID=2690290 RepID=UPI001367C1A6|nr:hypothetical protein [Streptomyces sp. SID4956]WSB91263.1 hypothetical protein OG805_12050 [Streptomyces cellulosae]
MSDVSSETRSFPAQSTGSLLNPHVNGSSTCSPPGKVTVSGGTLRSGGASFAAPFSARATFLGRR